ncbi:Uncharacterized protein APZ42_028051 [Daphnia magna]|uniref:Uncharacterized protein n=1 Tax=Daphnia magna TaxID=35525 RepID=A0A164QVG2_9CRUS|nr:Uncharacterized protein APZ42_028051 [Daphnia magna]
MFSLMTTFSESHFVCFPVYCPFRGVQGIFPPCSFHSSDFCAFLTTFLCPQDLVNLVMGLLSLKLNHFIPASIIADLLCRSWFHFNHFPDLKSRVAGGRFSEGATFSMSKIIDGFSVVIPHAAGPRATIPSSPTFQLRVIFPQSVFSLMCGVLRSICWISFFSCWYF